MGSISGSCNITSQPLDLKNVEVHARGLSKQTPLERADFTLQLLMFVTAEKGRVVFSNFFHILVCVSDCPRNFKLGQAERVQTKKAQTNRSRRQLFLM